MPWRSREWVRRLVVLDLSSRSKPSASPAGVWLDAAYLEARYTMGCGDHGHAAAVERSNKEVARVRKAIGYTYPKDNWRF